MDSPSTQNRLAALSFEQVRSLNNLIDEVVFIHGKGNFPTLETRLRDLVIAVKSKIEAEPDDGGDALKVRDIRLSGGAAAHILATESTNYNDLDLIFNLPLSSGRHFNRVKTAVMGSLFHLLPEGVSKKRITACNMKEAYVGKMVKVKHDEDRWSLISLGNSRGHRNVELKFVDSMVRQFEFSVDSFQIQLDSLLLFHASGLPISVNFYPTVVGESTYGEFRKALFHLREKYIATRDPEEIRGGGLLKYCHLLVRSYRLAEPQQIKHLETYMCTRFFVDFPHIDKQRSKLENYLWNHFVTAEEESLKLRYLTILHSVVDDSTSCLMRKERRQFLGLIEGLASHILCSDESHHFPKRDPPATVVHIAI